MGMFDEVNKKFGKWIQVLDSDNTSVTIEDFDYIMTPNVEDVKLIIPEGKEEWLFKDKQDWIRSLGYDNNDDFLKVIYKLIKQAYCDGDYKVKNHDKHGVKIDLYLTLPGAGSKLGRSYPVKSAFKIFPNGKLKCNTILGGRQ